jgi:hypothetical protein
LHFDFTYSWGRNDGNRLLNTDDVDVDDDDAADDDAALGSAIHMHMHITIVIMIHIDMSCTSSFAT